MTANTNNAYTTGFSDTIYSMLEQKSSHFLSPFSVETSTNDKHMFERLGSFTAEEIVDPRQDTVYQDADHSRRMATVRLYGATTSLSDLDQIKMMIDPTHEYTRKLARGLGRKLDDVVLAAMLGTAATGQDGTGSQAFDTVNNQVAHGSTGFNIAKLNAALRIMEGDEVDIDGSRLYIALGALAVEDMMAINEVISVDYQEGKALSSGNLPKLRGLNLIRAQNIPHETADTTYRGLIFTEDCMKIAMPKSLTVKTGENVNKNFLLTLNAKMGVGAVRMDEKLVVDVLYQAA